MFKYESNFQKHNLKRHIFVHKDDFSHDNRFRSVLNNDEKFAKLYDKISDELSRRKVGLSDGSDNSRYIGYISKDNRYIKYDRKTCDFVVYSGKYTITMHKKSFREYKRIRKRDFREEFPYNKNVEGTDNSNNKEGV